MIAAPPGAQAHCDGLDGPVVTAARRALAENNVKFALVWVGKNDESEIRRAFERTVAVRKLGAEARELADFYFFETLVRIHRAGEGAAFTGLKPAGRDLGPAIPAGDKAIETGDVEPVLRLLSTQLENGLHERFNDVLTKKKLSQDGIEAGRAFVKAYVDYIHYVEGLHQAAKAASPEHPGGGDEVSNHHSSAHHE